MCHPRPLFFDHFLSRRILSICCRRGFSDTCRTLRQGGCFRLSFPSSGSLLHLFSRTCSAPVLSFSYQFPVFTSDVSDILFSPRGEPRSKLSNQLGRWSVRLPLTFRRLRALVRNWARYLFRANFIFSSPGCPHAHCQIFAPPRRCRCLPWDIHQEAFT